MGARILGIRHGAKITGLGRRRGPHLGNVERDDGWPTAEPSVQRWCRDLAQAMTQYFGGVVGGTTPLASLTTNVGGSTQINANAIPHQPPAVFFGPEPPHTWCYYYEKASLARQQGDWAGVVRLGEQAASLNYAASDPVEWLPFIEATASLGQEAKMQEFIQRLQKDQNVTASICRVYASAPVPVRLSPEAFQTIKANLCAP